MTDTPKDVYEEAFADLTNQQLVSAFAGTALILGDEPPELAIDGAELLELHFRLEKAVLGRMQADTGEY